MKLGDLGDLGDLASARAAEALSAGDPVAALEWIDRIAEAKRPRQLEAEAAYRLARLELAAQRWGPAEEGLRRAVRAQPTPLYQKRLALIRRREPVMADREWTLLSCKIDPAERIAPDLLKPQIQVVHCCGAYYSRGQRSAAPWSRFLRMTKAPTESDEERQAIVNVACGYMARFVVEHTQLLQDVDVVVAIPANAGRYVDRGWSFPDELARGLEARLGLPFIFEAIEMAADVELRGLSWSERRRAIQGAMRPGNLNLARDSSVLVVDDVITSGATMREGARVLLAGGALSVSGLAMSHTEG